MTITAAIAAEARPILAGARADLGYDLGGRSALDLLADNLPYSLDELRAALSSMGEREPSRPGACPACGQVFFHRPTCRAKPKVLYCTTCAVYVEVGACAGNCVRSACVHDPGCARCHQ